MPKSFIWITRILVSLSFWAGLAACGPTIPADKPYLSVSEVWARTQVSAQETPGSKTPVWKTPVGPLGLGPNGVVFMKIDNQGGGADTLVKASSDVADSVELYEMKLSGERTTTFAVKVIDIPAKTLTELKSGSYYIRLGKLKKALSNGDKFNLTLEFSQSGKMTVEVAVSNP